MQSTTFIVPIYSLTEVNVHYLQLNKVVDETQLVFQAPTRANLTRGCAVTVCYMAIVIL